MKFQTLKRKGDFLRLLKEGTQKRDSDLAIFLIKKPDEDCNLRIGFIISKKTGGAVLRNKIKRIIKETLRETSIEICGGIDILFKINRNIRDIDFKKLKERLDNYIIPCIASRSRQ